MVLRDTDVFSSFSVDDLDVAREFYEDTLGLPVKQDAMGFLEIGIGDGRHILAYLKENHAPATFTVLNFTVSNIEEAVDKLIDAGIVMEQYDTPPIKTDEKGIARETGGPGICWFKDPAGNIIAVMELP